MGDITVPLRSNTRRDEDAGSGGPHAHNVICECKLVDFEKDGGTNADDGSFDTVWKNGAAMNTTPEWCSLHRAGWLCASDEQKCSSPCSRAHPGPSARRA